MTREEKVLVFEALHYLMNQIDVKGREGWLISAKLQKKIEELSK